MSARKLTSLRLNKEERSWCMYDWANSAYATIIMTALFPIYFSSVANSAGVSGDITWGYGTSIGTLLVVVLAPLFGSIADFQGMKKRLLAIFMLIGVVFTCTMAFVGTWQLMLIGYILSYLGFAVGNIFYDSLLTDVTSRERMDMVSAQGYSYGYIGGSTIPFIAGIVLVTFGDKFGIDDNLAVRICVVITSLWWGAFSIPILRNVKQRHYIPHPQGGTGALLKASFRNLIHTAKDIVSIRPLLMFMLAYFFYIDGVNTVIHMSTSYGTTLGLGTTGMIGALMLTQLIAVPCSVLFARLAERVGVRNALLTGATVYFVVCILGFYMGHSLENATIAAEAARLTGGEAAFAAIYEPARMKSQVLFWILACLVGTSQGGMQALSRSQFGRMIPPERSNEFYGFFDIFGKFAAVTGPFLYAFVASTTGRSSYGILSLIGLFGLGVVMLLLTPKESFSLDGRKWFDTNGSGAEHSGEESTEAS